MPNVPALFAKKGGNLRKVNPSTNNSLFVGIGQVHKKVNDRVMKCYTYSVLIELTELYKDLKILGHGIDKSLAEFKVNL